MSQPDTADVPPEAITKVKASAVCRDVLGHLREANAIATEIAEATGRQRSDVSRRLLELRKLGCVELLSDEDANAYRLYGITERGEAALEVVGE